MAAIYLLSFAILIVLIKITGKYANSYENDPNCVQVASLTNGNGTVDCGIDAFSVGYAWFPPYLHQRNNGVFTGAVYDVSLYIFDCFSFMMDADAWKKIWLSVDVKIIFVVVVVVVVVAV